MLINSMQSTSWQENNLLLLLLLLLFLCWAFRGQISGESEQDDISNALTFYVFSSRKGKKVYIKKWNFREDL